MPSEGIEILITCIILMLTVNDILDSFQMSLGSLLNWRECVHFYDYSSNMRKCRFAAFFLSIPFIFLVARYSLHPLAAVFGASPLMMVLGSALLFLAYLALRFIPSFILRRSVRSKPSAVQTFDIAESVSNPFFMLGVLVMTATSFFFPIFGEEQPVIRHWLLWEMALFYTVFIIRKTEIFISHRGFFAGFLYLCTLEIVPSGLLVVSAIL